MDVAENAYLSQAAWNQSNGHVVLIYTPLTTVADLLLSRALVLLSVRDPPMWIR